MSAYDEAYNARWYDPVLGRFAQADTIVPNPVDAKAFDRYAYVYNNPVRYNDPSGHCIGAGGKVKAVKGAASTRLTSHQQSATSNPPPAMPSRNSVCWKPGCKSEPSGW
ncbi:MAG TPA: RHS repeat-associated core domain-containing protein [Anaerolineales bacterium]|nr:RHS repeat-associated core domain-containing protein [Anaerolineales bacterium]